MHFTLVESYCQVLLLYHYLCLEKAVLYPTAVLMHCSVLARTRVHKAGSSWFFDIGNITWSLHQSDIPSVSEVQLSLCNCPQECIPIKASALIG